LSAAHLLYNLKLNSVGEEGICHERSRFSIKPDHGIKRTLDGGLSVLSPGLSAHGNESLLPTADTGISAAASADTGIPRTVRRLRGRDAGPCPGRGQSGAARAGANAFTARGNERV
jgi:hypothetical protein